MFRPRSVRTQFVKTRSETNDNGFYTFRGQYVSEALRSIVSACGTIAKYTEQVHRAFVFGARAEVMEPTFSYHERRLILQRILSVAILVVYIYIYNSPMIWVN